jgi:hypothetical protein
MALQVSEVETYLEAALGGSSASPYTTINIVNHTGQWLVNARPWKWLEGATANLGLVADQPWIALPYMRDIVSLHPTNGLTVQFEFTSLDNLQELRSTGTVSPLKYWGATAHSPVAGGGAPILRLELYPTPSSNETDFFVLHYHADWTEVETSTDYVSIPNWLEPLFLWSCTECVRAFEEYDKGAETGMLGYDGLSRIEQSKIWLDACARDGRLQPSLGTLQNGAAESGPQHWDTRFHVQVTNP